MRLIATLGVLLLTSTCASTTSRLSLPPLQTVPAVELQRYLGTWYEVASFPQSFQRGCTASTATYALRPDGDVEVVNRCRMETIDGVEKTVTGIARVVDQTNAKLEVSLFRPFWGQYWVIQLDPEYRFAVVGHPGRDYLGILSRAPTLDDETYAGILARLTADGYPLDRLIKTPQPQG